MRQSWWAPSFFDEGNEPSHRPSEELLRPEDEEALSLADFEDEQ
jgi:hypothetical protein